MSQSTQTPSMEEIIETAMSRRLSTVFVSLPGLVTEYDPGTRTVSVQPQIQQAHEGESGERVDERLPVLGDVPVIFVGSGNHSLTWPVSVGDVVQIHFQSSAIGKWKVRGVEVVPESDRHHDISDATAVPGLRCPSQTRSAATDCVALETPAPIRLGDRTANDPVMRKSDGIDLMTALAAAIATVGPSTPSGITLAALQTALVSLATSTKPAHVGQSWPVADSQVEVSDAP